MNIWKQSIHAAGLVLGLFFLGVGIILGFGFDSEEVVTIVENHTITIPVERIIVVNQTETTIKEFIVPCTSESEDSDKKSAATYHGAWKDPTKNGTSYWEANMSEGGMQ